MTKKFLVWKEFHFLRKLKWRKRAKLQKVLWIEKIEGVRYLTPHSCRHTYVSQMQALCIDMETIKSIVGHADLDMTRHYLHVQEPIRQAAVQKLSDAIASKPEKV